MNSVSATDRSTTMEYQAIETRLSDLDAKITHIFNRAVASSLFLQTLNTICIIGSVALMVFGTASWLLMESPYYAAFVKGALTASVLVVVFAGLTLFILGSNLRTAIENNPVTA